MNHSQSLGYISSLGRFGIKPGLERIEALCEALGDPQNDLRFLHVAGTNGKGSISTALSGACIAAGMKTGLFISPYVSDFMERIQINGRPASKEDFARAVTVIRPIADHLAAEGLQPTEFEVITAAAFLIFKRQRCDICVMEVGLGGRYDSTNIIPVPDVCVIGSISKDHSQILGDTLEEIAAEKCGVIKPGGVTVSYPLQTPSVARVIEEACEKAGSRLIVPDLTGLGDIEEKPGSCSFSFDGRRFSLSMGGRYQAYNAVTAYTAALAAGLDENHAALGVEGARLPARMEFISSDPVVILDGGHNADGGRALAESLGNVLPGRSITAVIGMMADKEIDAYLSSVAPLCAEMIAVPVAGSPRAMSAEALAEVAAKYCSRVSHERSARRAIDKAAAKGFDCLLVCGSLYLAGEARPRLLELFGGPSANNY